MSNESAFNNKMFSDFTIENSSKTEILYLHKIILSSNEYFKVLFSDLFKDVNKLYFDNINIPKLLTYYIYAKDINNLISINEVKFNELMLLLSLADEWLMFDYIKVIIDEYVKINDLKIDELIEISRYYENVFNIDKVRNIITEDIKINISNNELIKYRNINIEGFELESRIILYTYFERFEDVNQLLETHGYYPIYEIIKRFSENNLFNEYMEFCNFMRNNQKTRLKEIKDIYISHKLNSKQVDNVQNKYHIIESIHPLSITFFRMLSMKTDIYRTINGIEINLYDIHIKINRKDSLVIIDKYNYCLVNISKIKVNNIEVSSASKYKDVVIEIDRDPIMYKKLSIFILRKRTYV
jgi:hypothetical protein